MTAASSPGPAAPGTRLADAAFLLAVLAAPLTVSQFLRNAIGVVAPDLMREFALTPAEAGLLASAFFLAFAAMQIPLGPFIDLKGPKRAILIGLGLVAAGSAVFATAAGMPGLIAGRVLSGIGCASMYMSALTILARNFAPSLFATLAGLQVGIGNLGTIAATAPLAYAAGTWGWRASFAAVGAIGLVFALGVAAYAPADPKPREGHGGWLAAFAGLSEVIRVPSFWPIFLMHMVGLATFVTIAGLWAGPWLADVYGLGLQERGGYLVILAVAQILGMVLIAPTDRLLKSYRKPVMLGAGASAALLAFAALVPIPLGLLPVWLGLFGFFIAFTPVLTAHGKSLFPPHLIGRGLTLLNCAVMAGAFLMQTLTGFIIGAFAPAGPGVYGREAYAAVFAAVAATLVACLVAYRRSHDRHPDAKA
jgi:MFS family permease